MAPQSFFNLFLFFIRSKRKQLYIMPSELDKKKNNRIAKTTVRDSRKTQPTLKIYTGVVVCVLAHLHVVDFLVNFFLCLLLGGGKKIDIAKQRRLGLTLMNLTIQMFGAFASLHVSKETMDTHAWCRSIQRFGLNSKE